MVATGSLSSKNPGSISELLDHGFHPGSLLNGEFPSCSPLSTPESKPLDRRDGRAVAPLSLMSEHYKIHLKRLLPKLSSTFCSW